MGAITLAIYIDIENLPRGVDFDLMMEHLGGNGAGHVCAIKAAYGSAASLSKQYRRQLLDHNFHIVDTPHVVAKKNRADLIISIDAFERLFVNTPAIDRYVFVSSDSDFTVIMDKLRSYGKQVWAVCRKADQAKKILIHCCDRILSVEDFVSPPSPPPPTVDVVKSQWAERLVRQALSQIGMGSLPVSLSTVGMHMRKLDGGFDFKETGFKRLTDLMAHCEAEGIVRLGTSARGATQIDYINRSTLEERDGSDPERSPGL